jgi:hypothetical protein
MMKKAIFLFCTVIFITSFVSSQSNDVYKEANPDQTYIHDNSRYADLWRQQLDARNNGNTELYNQLGIQLMNEFPERFTGNTNTGNLPQAVTHHTIQPPFIGDWGAGDYIVVNSPAYQPPANNTQAGLDLEVDSLGNKYVAYISGNRDTLRIMKSTDQGVTWFYILHISPGGTNKWHSFDFFIADSSSGFKLGFAAARTSTASTFDGEMFWMACDQNGGGFFAVNIFPTPGGVGYLNPTIVADSYYWSYGNTYWYMAFQQVNSATGVGNSNRAALSTNSGLAWIQDTVRNSFNDFNLDIDYRSSTSDTIYVAYANDITPANPNLRINRIALGNFGTATGWTQFNNQASADPEVDPEIAVNRQTNQMACIWTQTTGGVKKVNVNYTELTGAYWANLSSVANFSHDCDRGRLECSEQQGAYRLSYVAKGTTADTVVYTSAFSPPFAGRTIVSANINAATTTSPDVSGFMTGPAAFGGGVVFVGAGQNRIFYDGSNVSPVVGISNNGGEVPNAFSLSQNYPNPFNPTTNIKFAIPQASFVTLKVYDMLGREVASLISEEMTAGSYTVDWNALNFTSGVYFYKISAGNFTDTKRMVLIK